MHIAICDDNVADRKQTERLMGRESDKWNSNGVPLYYYSFGSVDSLLANSMKFDVIILDVSNADAERFGDILKKMTSKGMDGVLVYSNPLFDEAVKNREAIYMPKPFNLDSLHQGIGRLREIFSNKVGMIELRGLMETLYVTEDEIMYAVPDADYTIVTLTEYRKIRVHGFSDNFYEEIRAAHDCFILTGFMNILNVNYVASVGLMSVTMCDGKRFRVNGEVKAYIKQKTDK